MVIKITHKLTEEEKQEIRSRYGDGTLGISQRQLAEEYGVTQPAIYRIINEERSQAYEQSPERKEQKTRKQKVRSQRALEVRSFFRENAPEENHGYTGGRKFNDETKKIENHGILLQGSNPLDEPTFMRVLYRIAEGESRKDACLLEKVSPQSLYAQVHKHPEIKERVERAEAYFRSNIRKMTLDSVKTGTGNPQTLFKMLQAVQPETFGPPAQKVETTGTITHAHAHAVRVWDGPVDGSQPRLVPRTVLRALLSSPSGSVGAPASSQEPAHASEPTSEPTTTAGVIEGTLVPPNED